MEDPTSNLIAWLFPVDKAGRAAENAKEVINHDKNKSRFLPALRENTDPGVYSRESTAQPEDDEDEEYSEVDEDNYGHKHNTQNDGNDPGWHYQRGLQLTFNHPVKGRQGITMGTDEDTCDIVVPNFKTLKSRVGRRHCYLTFDDERRLVLKDCSSNGTVVTYDGQGGKLRRNFVWILGGHDVPQEKKEIVIELHKMLQFQIIVFTHQTQPDVYANNVDRFLQQAEANNLAGLGLGSYDPSRASSKADTPDTGAIYLVDKRLGIGGFAIVTRQWNVSTGYYYAVKEPLNTKKGKFDPEMWEAEINIMKQISHEHIVKLCAWRTTPAPRLVLEYVPLGNLEDEHCIRPFQMNETWAILSQCLSALQYLHGLEIVHRDLKPGNILVETREPLYIKLADFGLAKEGDYLSTIVGTFPYTAPEIAQLRISSFVPRERYTSSVDIWSLGVVVLRFGYGPLRGHKGAVGSEWCRKIIERVSGLESEHLIDLLRGCMIVWDPKSRYSASACLDVLQQLNDAQSRTQAPTSASYSGGQETTTGYRARGLVEPEDIGLNPAPAEKRKKSLQTATSSSSSAKANSKGKRNTSSANRHVQQDESEAGLVLFGEGWLQDPNCVGSSVAALGQESSSSNSESTTRLPSKQKDDGTVTQAWTESEVYMARLLQAMHEQKEAGSESRQPTVGEWVWDEGQQRYRGWNGNQWVWN